MLKDMGWLEKRRHERVESVLRIQFMELPDAEVPVLLGDEAFRETSVEKLSKSFQPDKILEGFTEDLSTGGLLLASDKPLRQGQYLLLEMVLPTARRSMRVIAMAVRVTENQDVNRLVHRSGIQMVAIHKEDLEELQKFLQKQNLQNLQKKLDQKPS